METSEVSLLPPAIDLPRLMQIAYGIGDYWTQRWSPLPMRYWYRGSDDESFSLNPSLLRPPFRHLDLQGAELDRDMQQAEYEIAIDFRTRGRPYFKWHPMTPWEEMLLMQHYGFPTRLLDWTESLVNAAYFACRDVTSEKDGAVWMMAPNYLLEKVDADGQRNYGGTHLPTTNEALEAYKPISRAIDLQAFAQLPPLPLFPEFIDVRITAQRGRFTVHTFQERSLEQLNESDASAVGQRYSFLQKVIIPASAKPTIRQQALIFGGADEASMFPDLEGLSRAMRFDAIESHNERHPDRPLRG